MTEKYILETSTLDVINDAVVATIGLDDNFSSYSIVNYVCSALLLQLTGLLEQKFRAVTWIMAINSREYRRNFLNNQKFGEYSNYDVKSRVYKNMLAEIFILNKNDIKILHSQYASEAKLFILDVFKSTIFYNNYNHAYYEFKNNLSLVSCVDLIIKNGQNTTYQLIPSSNVKKYFDILIDERNKIAHNVYVCHSATDDFHTLFESDGTNNYFIKFFLLVYLDKILNGTYAIYDALIQEKCLTIY